MCASLPFSICRSLPYGYGPPSLSLAYWNVNVAVAWLLSTTLKGMPYGGPPKSGCSRRPELAPVELSQEALWLLTGSVEMSAFQTLLAGKTLHDVPGTGAALTGAAGREA